MASIFMIAMTISVVVLLLFSVVITKQKQQKHNIQQLEVPLRLKTKDQVTFSISLKVFYKVVEDVREAFKAEYNLNHYDEQMLSVATDSAIPVANGVELEHVFNSKEDILVAAERALTTYFRDYGIEIEKVLSDEPQLPEEVENSANEVIAAQRLNDAARFKADAIRTEKVGEATADGESVKIRMEEVGKARKEYAETTSAAIDILKASGVDPSTALNFLTRVGDQDALVTASRNSETAILSLAQPNTATKLDPLAS